MESYDEQEMRPASKDHEDEKHEHSRGSPETQHKSS